MGKDDFKIDLDFDLSKYDYSNDKKAEITLEDILGKTYTASSEPKAEEVPVKPVETTFSSPELVADELLTEVEPSVEPQEQPLTEMTEKIQSEPLFAAADSAVDDKMPETPFAPDFLIDTDDGGKQASVMENMDSVSPLFFAEDSASAEAGYSAESNTPDLIFDLGEKTAEKLEETFEEVHSAQLQTESEEQSAAQLEPAAVEEDVSDEDVTIAPTKKQRAVVVDEYSSIEEREDILSDLEHLVKKITSKTVVMLLLVLAGAYLTLGRLEPLRFLLPDFIDPALQPRNYCLITLVLTVVCFLFNLSPMMDGLKKIFKARMTTDGISLALGLCCMVYNVYFILFPDSYPELLINFDIIFILMLFMNLLGKRLLVKHILANFEMFSDEQLKTVISRPAVLAVNNDIMIETGDGGDVLYAAKTKRVAGYMKSAFGEQSTPRKTDVFYFVMHILMLLIAVVLYVFNLVPTHLLMVFVVAMVAICAPLFSSWTHTLAVYRIGRYLRESGTMVSGREGAEALSESGVLVVRDSDLITDANIGLHGMRIREGYDTKQVLTYLSALFAKVGGPLDGFFYKILEDSTQNKLPAVKDVYYYEQQGYTFAIDSKRASVGTEEFMLQLGIKCPQNDHSASATDLFVALDGKLAGIFTLSYSVPKKTQKALALIDAQGMSLAIVTSDFNLNEEMFTKYVSDPEMITVLSYETGMKCDKLCGQIDEAVADVVTTDGIRGMALGLHGCSQLLSNCLTHGVYKITASVFGLIVIIVMGILLSAPNYWLPFQILAYQLIWSIPNYFRGIKTKI